VLVSARSLEPKKKLLFILLLLSCLTCLETNSNIQINNTLTDNRLTELHKNLQSHFDKKFPNKLFSVVVTADEHLKPQEDEVYVCG
jgi:hypothetical protein